MFKKTKYRALFKEETMKKNMYFILAIILFSSLWIIPSSSNAIKGDFNSDGSIDINDAIFGLQVLAGMRNDPPKETYTMINLGDSLTNGTQSGNRNVHEPTQKNGFVQLVANQMQSSIFLNWSNPYLKKNADGSKARINPDEIPYNLGVDSATIKELMSGRTDDLLNLLVSPIPDLKKAPVSQLEAAIYVAGKRPETEKKIITLWVGNNDVLWSVINGYGSQITENNINAYLNDTAAEHDLESIKANLTEVVNQLKAIPNSHIFIGTLPYMTGPAFFFSKDDIERLAQFQNPNITALKEGESIGFGPFLELAKVGSFKVDSNTANAAIGTLTDTHILSPNEIKIVDDQIKEINAHINTLKEEGKVTIVNTFEVFQSIYDNSVEINGHKIYKTFGCGGFSFDAFHPSNTLHALIANEFIEKINESLGLSIPSVDVGAVFENDPYQDRDGDHFAPGPGADIIGADLFPLGLYDCDDTNADIVAPFISGDPCQGKK